MTGMEELRRPPLEVALPDADTCTILQEARDWREPPKHSRKQRNQWPILVTPEARAVDLATYRIYLTQKSCSESTINSHVQKVHYFLSLLQNLPEPLNL
eukprot:6330275-Amphidinium_carterae.1